MLLKDPEEYKRAIALGRQNIFDAKHQIWLTLKRRIEEFEQIPANRLQLWIMELIHKGMLSKLDNEFNEMQDYYELYLEATKLLAVSYYLTNNIDAAEKVFEDSMDAMGRIRFTNAQTIRFIHSKEHAQDLFVFHAVTYIKAEQEEAKENAKEYDYMLIEVAGEDLMEAFKNGKKVRKQEDE